MIKTYKFRYSFIQRVWLDDWRDSIDQEDRFNSTMKWFNDKKKVRIITPNNSDEILWCTSLLSDPMGFRVSESVRMPNSRSSVVMTAESTS